VTQETAMLVMLAAATAPLPLETVQVCVLGCVVTVTPKVAPLASDVGNVNVPSPMNIRESLPFAIVTLPMSPDSSPPTV